MWKNLIAVLSGPRVQSLLWRSAMMAVAAGLAFVADNLGVLELNPELTAFVGLIFGEVSKAINNKYQENKGLR